MGTQKKRATLESFRQQCRLGPGSSGAFTQAAVGTRDEWLEEGERGRGFLGPRPLTAGSPCRKFSGPLVPAQGSAVTRAEYVSAELCSPDGPRGQGWAEEEDTWEMA